MRKERVEVGFGSQMQYLRVMGMIDVCKDAQELPVDMLHG